MWINIDWFLMKGLEAYGYKEPAQRLRRTIVELCQKEGFHEYFDPTSGQGRGSILFSWSAALLLDVLMDDGGGKILRLRNKVAVVTGARCVTPESSEPTRIRVDHDGSRLVPCPEVGWARAWVRSLLGRRSEGCLLFDRPVVRTLRW